MLQSPRDAGVGRDPTTADDRVQRRRKACESCTQRMCRHVYSSDGTPDGYWVESSAKSCLLSPFSTVFFSVVLTLYLAGSGSTNGAPPSGFSGAW